MLHPRAPDGSCGYFGVARRFGKDDWRERLYSVDAAEPVVRALAGVEDAYITQATFVRKRRLASLAHTLRCAFTDLDLYNVNMRADDASVEAVVRHASDVGIPQPSLVVSSGRGLYAKWLFDTPITSTLMPQWNALQATLIGLYRGFGCDPKVRDAARVLRPASSINSKSGATVKVVLDTGRTWSFAELCEQVGRVSVATPEPQTPGEDCAGGARASTSAAKRTRMLLQAGDLTDFGHLSTYSARSEPIMMRQMTAQSLNWARFLDLRDLAIARGGFHQGWRDEFLFWMVCFLGHSGVITGENFEREVQQLLMAFPRANDFQPLTDGSLQTIKRKIQEARQGKFVRYQGARMSPIYTPTNDYLMERMQITPQEERSLRTLISGQERQRRADAKVPGRSERRQQRQESAQVILALSQQGVSASEIAATVGCSRAKVYRTRLKADADAAAPAAGERRGRRSPYQQHQQQLPPGSKFVDTGEQLPILGSKRKSDLHELTPRELRRRGATTPPPSLESAAPAVSQPSCEATSAAAVPAQLQDCVRQRLAEISLAARTYRERRQEDLRRQAQAEEAEEAQLRLRMHARLMRIMAHVRHAPQEPPAGAPRLGGRGGPADRLKPAAAPGRLCSSTPPAAGPPRPPRR